MKWTLPAGWKAGPLLFPTPGKFVEQSLVAYGYRNDVVFLAPLQAAPGAPGRPAIRAALDWLVCKESCIRGKAVLELAAQPADVSAEAEILRRSLRNLPRPMRDSGLSIGRASLTANGDEPGMTVLFEGPHAGRISDFHPERIQEGVIDLLSIRVSQGALSLKFSPTHASSLPRQLAGLAIIDGTGYEVTAIFKTKGEAKR